MCPHKDPRHCAHRTIHRVINHWYCVECDAAFVPKNPRYKTKWSDERRRSQIAASQP